MLRKTLSAIAVAAILTVSVPFAANAAEDDEYTPHNPTEPTLAGSLAVGECVADVPWIRYDVTLTDPDSQVTTNTATLILTDGANVAEVPLGTLTNGHVSGSVLWPGASVDGGGNPTGWPGWAYQNGQWVETSGNFAWTRGTISATIRVNPDLAVPLAYPPATPNCTAGPTALSPDSPSESSNSGTLPATGSTVPVIAIGFGVGLLALGGIVLFMRRRSTHS